MAEVAFVESPSDELIILGLTDDQVNVGLGNGFVPSGNKPWPKPMLTQFYVAIWHH